jgi:hypothetical protein
MPVSSQGTALGRLLPNAVLICLRYGLDRRADRANELVDLPLVDDQRRRERNDVAGDAGEDTAVEAVDEDLEASGTGRTRPGLELDPADESQVTNVNDVGTERGSRLARTGPRSRRRRVSRDRQPRRAGAPSTYSRGRAQCRPAPN